MSRPPQWRLCYVNNRKKTCSGIGVWLAFSKFALEMNSVFITIDRGNTRTKAALWTPQGTMCAHGTYASDLPPCRIFSDLNAGNRLGIEKYALCSVRKSADKDFVYELADSLPGITVDAHNCAPLAIDYATPHTLGADRIAAAAGALAAAGHGRLLVADIGTAATFDYVDENGVFVGGNISAGIAMRLAALHEHTSALPLAEAAPGVSFFGTDTLSALRAGAVRGLVAELEYYRRATGATTYVTGGDADAVLAAAAYTDDYIHDPFLVMKGLFSILKHND